MFCHFCFVLPLLSSSIAFFMLGVLKPDDNFKDYINYNSKVSLVKKGMLNMFSCTCVFSCMDSPKIATPA